ncbi:inositol monophosphatase family protein [Rhodobacteraceae bacterium SC52]|nr:inositol monophosphatase family protein [Rhodobacteraceae bacterium SC52]
MHSSTELDDDVRQSLIGAAHAVADAAAQITLANFRSAALQTDNKQAGGFDPVTQADRAAEQAMRAVLADLRPDDAILGEEFGPKEGTSGFMWVLDPIDGTRGYISGTPTWGTLVAVNAAHGPVFGLVDQPYTGERFAGGLGISELMRGETQTPLKTKVNTTLEASILFTTFPEIGTPNELVSFRRVAEKVRLVRYGMDCYAYALLAAGQIDLVIEAGLNAYDVAAPIAVIQAAGGTVTNWEGGPAHDGGRILAAATPELHRTALTLLKGV